MSDLSFLIQNQNEVQVDQSFLEKYQKQPTKIQKPQTKPLNDNDFPKKQIKLKKKLTQIQGKKKKFPVKSYTSEHLPLMNDKIQKIMNPEQKKYPSKANSNQGENQKYFELIEKRIAQMLNNQKTIEDQISSNLFDLKYALQLSDKSDKNLNHMMQKTKHQVKKTQKGIGQILSLIERHSQQNKNTIQVNF